MSEITLKNIAFTFTVAELSIDRGRDANPFSVLASLLSCATPVDDEGDDGDEGAAAAATATAAAATATNAAATANAAAANAAIAAAAAATAANAAASPAGPTATATATIMPSKAEVGAFLKSSDKPLRTTGAIMEHFSIPEPLTGDVEQLLEDMVDDGTLERRTRRADRAALWGHADRVGL